MAAGDWWESSPGLKQLFGSIVASAEQGATTAQVWDDLRTNAADLAQSTLSLTLGREPTESEVATGAANLLRGVDAIKVGYARQFAGQMVSAHGELTAHDPDQQIEYGMIARPPWAITVNAYGVREQYRIRVNREITFHGVAGDVVRQEWASYSLTGPLTTINDALSQADSMFTGADYNRRTSINQTLDYTIEAV